MRYQASLMLTAAALILAVPAAAQQTASERHISGRVLSPQATPAAEVEVCARPLFSYHPRRGQYPPCVHSDADGRFSIPVYVSTTYFLTAKKESEGHPDAFRIFYRVPFLNVSGIVVADGQSPPEVTLQLGPPVAQLTGSITDAESGQPIKRVRVRLCHTKSPGYCATFDPVGLANLRYTMDSDGRYTMDVPPAPLAVEVMAEGYEDWAAPEPLHFTSGERRELNVALLRPGRTTRGLPAPKPKAPADGAVLKHFPRKTVLEWSPVRGAASYQVEIEFFYRCGDPDCAKYGAHELPSDPPQYGLAETRYEFEFIGAQRGRWRVRALDPQGRAGAKSAWVNFCYTR